MLAVVIHFSNSLSLSFCPFCERTWAVAARQRHPLDHDALVAGMVEAFDADPEHGATGRSAPSRLVRALAHADEADLEVPTLRTITGEIDW